MVLVRGTGMYWSHFPRDIQREILLRLSYDDVLCLCKDATFSWISRDAEYWGKRSGVGKWVFIATTDDYHWLYLRLRYGGVTTELLQNALVSHGYIVCYAHWVSVVSTVLLDPAMSYDMKYEFSLYIFGCCYHDWGRIVCEGLGTIVAHCPKILKWIATTGVRLVLDTRGLVVAAYESGGMSAVHWLEAITDIDWNDALKSGAHRYPELVQYIERD